MDELRPIQLREEEKAIYDEHDEIERREKEEAAKEKAKQEALADSTKKPKHSLGDILWNIGDKLVTSSHKDAGAASFTLSPIINPQYISYSKAKGVSYKIQFGVRYHWNSKRYLTIQPQLGYNFGIKQFYHYTPIRMTYNPKRNGYAEIVFANGNRISNSSVIEVIRNIYGNDSAKHYQKMEMDYFNDNYIQAINNVQAYDWLEIKAGIVYHIRKPKNPSVMEKLNMPTVYRSFAPTLTLHISPWRRGPYFTLNYERSIKGIMGANLEYERYEFDASHRFKLLGLRSINLKGGFGVYTNNSYIADIVTDIIGNSSRIARVVLRNIGLDLADDVCTHIGCFGIDATSHTGKECLGGSTHSEGKHRGGDGDESLGVETIEDHKPDGNVKQSKTYHRQSHHRTGTECYLQPGIKAVAGSIGCAC